MFHPDGRAVVGLRVDSGNRIHFSGRGRLESGGCRQVTEAWELARRCGMGSSMSCPNCSLSIIGRFLIISLALPILILGTGWLLYFVPFGWMLALTSSYYMVTIPSEKRKFGNEWAPSSWPPPHPVLTSPPHTLVSFCPGVLDIYSEICVLNFNLWHGSYYIIINSESTTV